MSLEGTPAGGSQHTSLSNITIDSDLSNAQKKFGMLNLNEKNSFRNTPPSGNHQHQLVSDNCHPPPPPPSHGPLPTHGQPQPLDQPPHGSALSKIKNESPRNFSPMGSMGNENGSLGLNGSGTFNQSDITQSGSSMPKLEAPSSNQVASLQPIEDINPIYTNPSSSLDSKLFT